MRGDLLGAGQRKSQTKATPASSTAHNGRRYPVVPQQLAGASPHWIGVFSDGRSSTLFERRCQLERFMRRQE